MGQIYVWTIYKFLNYLNIKSFSSEHHKLFNYFQLKIRLKLLIRYLTQTSKSQIGYVSNVSKFKTKVLQWSKTQRNIFI